MIVYLAMYDSDEVESIWSTEEKARRRVAKWGSSRVRPAVVDEKENFVAKKMYTVDMDLLSGVSENRWREENRHAYREVDVSATVCEPAQLRMGKIEATSFVSYEHAHGMCAEHRTKLLKEAVTSNME